MTDKSDRYLEVSRRVDERYLAEDGDRWAYGNDAPYHADILRLRQLVTAVDAAMEAEGISEESRDQVMFRLLYGRPPESFSPPSWIDAAARAADRHRDVMRLMQEFPPRAGGS